MYKVKEYENISKYDEHEYIKIENKYVLYD